MIVREAFDQYITPLGDHMPIDFNFLKTGNDYAIRNKEVSYGISEDLPQNHFDLGRSFVEFRWAVIWF